MGIKFEEFRNYVSRTDRISICLEDGSYENFFFIRDVPHTYDELYLYETGIIESEFPPFENWSGEGPAWEDGIIVSPIEFVSCLEIVLHKLPREIEDKLDTEMGKWRDDGIQDVEIDLLKGQLGDLRARREEAFQNFKDDKGNPYWYEDWGSNIDDLDEQIACLQNKISYLEKKD